MEGGGECFLGTTPAKKPGANRIKIQLQLITSNANITCVKDARMERNVFPAIFFL